MSYMKRKISDFNVKIFNKKFSPTFTSQFLHFTYIFLYFLVMYSLDTFLLIPLFHTGPESHELTRIDKYLDSWLNRTQFVMVLTDSHSP